MTKNKKRVKLYTVGEEIANSISHGVGTLLSIAGLVLLIVKVCYTATATPKWLYITAFSIFGGSLIILYLASTLYHALVGGAKQVFRVFDHCSIYLLIAGTYSAYCLTVLYEHGGIPIFFTIWGLAVLGIVLYAIFGSKVKVISFILYIIMGWLIMVLGKSLISLLSPLSFKLLLAGGISYTAGCIFYGLTKIKWMHCIWHLFVLAGSILHFFSIWYMF